MSVLRSPLLPLVGAGVLSALPWTGASTAAVSLLALAIRAAWLWWSRLSITVDGVHYKEPAGAAALRIQLARHIGNAEPALATPRGRRQASGGGCSLHDAGFVTPRDDGEAKEDAASSGLVAQGLVEWAPFAPSFPYGEQPPPPPPSPTAGACGASPPAQPEGAPFWEECDATVFDVRNIRYKQTREKVPSEFALYDCVGMDMIRDKRRIDSLVDRLPAAGANAGSGPAAVSGDSQPGTSREALPPSPAGATEWSVSWGVPRVLIVNCQLPYKAGRLIGAHPEDDGGLSVASYFVLSKRSSELLSRGSPTPSLRLWRRFVEEGVSTKEGISLKVVGRVEDLEKYEVPESFHRFNNKPVLLTKSATVLSHRLPEVMEIDYDVRGWVFLARSTLANYHHRAREAELEIGYLVEGKADDELPEQILGCFKLNNMDITAAHWVSLM